MAQHSGKLRSTLPDRTYLPIGSNVVPFWDKYTPQKGTTMEPIGIDVKVVACTACQVVGTRAEHPTQTLAASS